MTEAVTDREGMGVQVDCMDREIGRVLKAKDHYRRAQKANQMRERIDGL